MPERRIPTHNQTSWYLPLSKITPIRYRRSFSRRIPNRNRTDSSCFLLPPRTLSGRSPQTTPPRGLRLFLRRLPLRTRSPTWAPLSPVQTHRFLILSHRLRRRHRRSRIWIPRPPRSSRSSKTNFPPISPHSYREMRQRQLLQLPTPFGWWVKRSECSGGGVRMI